MQTIPVTGAAAAVRTASGIRWFGVLLAAAALVQLVSQQGLVLAVVEQLPIPLSGTGWTVAAALLLGAALLVLALRVPGAAGRTPLGPVLLVCWAAGPLLGAVDVLLPSTGATQPFQLVVGTGLQYATPVIALVASALMVRARVLPGVTRWALLLSALLQVASTALLLAAPALSVALLLGFPGADLAQLLDLIAGVTAAAAGSRRRRALLPIEEPEGSET